MPGKTPMWGNPMREREIYYSASGKYISAAITQFPAKRKTTYNTKNCPKNFCLDFVPSPYCCTTHPKICTSKSVQTVCCTDCSVWPNSNKKNAQNNLENRANVASIFVPSSPCCTGLYGSVQYGLQQQKNDPTLKQKFLLGICAQYLLGNVPSLLPSFLSQAYSKISLNLLLSMCLAHYPMHSFIKSEDDLFPPKCLFTFPNPKSKGQDLILPLQDQGP
jgi:hypothetical protein